MRSASSTSSKYAETAAWNDPDEGIALLRPVGDASTQDAVREAVLAALAEAAAAAAVAK